MQNYENRIFIDIPFRIYNSEKKMEALEWLNGLWLSMQWNITESLRRRQIF